MKLERRARILVKLGFKELCDSKLSGLYTFDEMAISLSQDDLKRRRYAVSSQDTDP